MAKSKKKQNRLPLVLCVVLPLSALAVSAFAVSEGIQNYLATSSYFRVADVRFEGINDTRYVDLMRSEIAGVNIFGIDTRRLAERIKNKFPLFYKVTVTKVLPQGLYIVAKERRPVGVIKAEKYFLFDAEGVVLSALPLQERLSYPLIAGLENKLPKMRVGASYNSEALREALVLARALGSRKFPLGVTKIDASAPGRLSFYLGEDMEIKIGRGDYHSRLNLLPAILKSIGPDLSAVAYIDLRPKEPVAAMKTTKERVRLPRA